MAHATDIVGYTYSADLYCPDCVLRAVGATGAEVSERYVEPTLDQLARKLGIDRHDERSFDSGEFPKVVFRSMLDTSNECLECGVPSDMHDDSHSFFDSNDRCASCGEVLGE